MGGSSSDYGQSITIDVSGNVYTTGAFSDTIDFDPGTGIHYLNSAGSFDAHILKLDALGNFIWAKNMGGAYGAGGYSLALDFSGNVYTCGGFLDTADFNPGIGYDTLISNGANDIYLSKLDTNGNYIWSKNMGGGSSDIGLGIAVDAYENVYATGYFGGTAWFDTSTYLTSDGFNDIFLFKSTTPSLTVDIQEQTVNLDFKIYPNPTKNRQLNVRFCETQKEGKIEVRDLMGSLVYSMPFQNSAQLSFSFDVAPGIYIVSIQTQNGVMVSKKIIKN